MFRCLIGLSLLIVAASSVAAQTQSSSVDIQTELSRAEALYFKAQFKESIVILLPLDVALRDQPGRIPEAVKVKLQLALAHMGLDENDAAQMLFEELCRLDPDYVLDSSEFAPKVLSLFSKSRDAAATSRCSAACTQAKMLLNQADLRSLLAWLPSAPKGCDCLKNIGEAASELAVKQGVEEYNNNDTLRAIKSFEMALAFDPKNEVAARYMELTQTKVQLVVDRLAFDWKRHFESSEFVQARTAYRQLEAPELAPKSAPALEHARMEYRKHASAIAETWKRNCASPRSNPASSLEGVQHSLSEVLPDASLAQDILNGITPCDSPPPVSESCLQFQAQQAMVRLENGVEPQIPRSLRPLSPVTAFVKITVDKRGDVKVREMRVPNVALVGPLREAVEQWRFTPAIQADTYQIRCVDTELPILLTP